MTLVVDQGEQAISTGEWQDIERFVRDDGKGSLPLELLASGASQDDILRAYPHVPAEGLSAALKYAAQALGNEVVWDVKTTA